MSHKRYDDCTIIIYDDGSISLAAFDRKAGLITDGRLKPARALGLREWFTSAEWRPGAKFVDQSDTVSYNQETDTVTLNFQGTETHYRAGSDESMAKMVRHLKRRNWYHVPKEEVQELPLPSQDGVATTRYTNPRAVKGSGHRPARKASIKEASPEATERMVLDALASLKKEML